MAIVPHSDFAMDRMNVHSPLQEPLVPDMDNGDSNSSTETHSAPANTSSHESELLSIDSGASHFGTQSFLSGATVPSQHHSCTTKSVSAVHCGSEIPLTYPLSAANEDGYQSNAAASKIPTSVGRFQSVSQPTKSAYTVSCAAENSVVATPSSALDLSAVNPYDDIVPSHPTTSFGEMFSAEISPRQHTTVTSTGPSSMSTVTPGTSEGTTAIHFVSSDTSPLSHSQLFSTEEKIWPMLSSKCQESSPVLPSSFQPHEQKETVVSVPESPILESTLPHEHPQLSPDKETEISSVITATPEHELQHYVYSCPNMFSSAQLPDEFSLPEFPSVSETTATVTNATQPSLAQSQPVLSLYGSSSHYNTYVESPENIHTLNTPSQQITPKQPQSQPALQHLPMKSYSGRTAAELSEAETMHCLPEASTNLDDDNKSSTLQGVVCSAGDCDDVETSRSTGDSNPQLVPDNTSQSTKREERTAIDISAVCEKKANEFTIGERILMAMSRAIAVTTEQSMRERGGECRQQGFQEKQQKVGFHKFIATQDEEEQNLLPKVPECAKCTTDSCKILNVETLQPFPDYSQCGSGMGERLLHILTATESASAVASISDCPAHVNVSTKPLSVGALVGAKFAPEEREEQLVMAESDSEMEMLQGEDERKLDDAVPPGSSQGTLISVTNCASSATASVHHVHFSSSSPPTLLSPIPPSFKSVEHSPTLSPSPTPTLQSTAPPQPVLQCSPI